jgi:hypothetical protein
MSNLPKVDYLKVDGTTPSIFEKLKAYRLGAQQIPMPPWWVFVLFFVVAIVVAVVVITQIKEKTATPENAKSTLQTQLTAVQTAISTYYKNRKDVRSIVKSTPQALGAQVQENENSFINFAPLTCQDTGYIGPLENGVFAENDAVNMALRAGARCFVLNIDYHEDQTLPVELFGKPFDPRLIYRDAGGVVKCINTGEIKLVAQALANTAFSNTVSNPNDPLFVVLFFQREPKGSLDDKLVYYSKVAEQLEPLIPYHLGQTPQGDYHRQQKQNDLIYQPITDFEKKVVVFCNVDTAIFRGKNYAPTRDLDYFVHLRLFKESTDTYGATGAVESRTMPRGIVNSVANFSIIPQNKYKDTSDGTKMRWTMAYTNAATNPSETSLKYMMQTLGVQSIPLWLFSTKPPSSSAMKDLRAKLAENAPDVPTIETPDKLNQVAGATATSAAAAGAQVPSAPAPPTDEKPKEDDFPKLMAPWLQSSFVPKPKTIRFIRPANFTPQAPSPRLDAQGGNLTTPTL